MIIFTKEELGHMSNKQLNNLRLYYSLPDEKKPKLVDLLYELINTDDDVVDSSEVQMSVQVRRIYDQMKKGE